MYNLSHKQDRQCTYNVTLRRARAATVAVEKQTHPARHAHAPYCRLWHVQLYNIVHYLINCTVLGKKLQNIKCMF